MVNADQPYATWRDPTRESELGPVGQQASRGLRAARNLNRIRNANDSVRRVERRKTCVLRGVEQADLSATKQEQAENGGRGVAKPLLWNLAHVQTLSNASDHLSADDSIVARRNPSN